MDLQKVSYKVKVYKSWIEIVTFVIDIMQQDGSRRVQFPHGILQRVFMDQTTIMLTWQVAALFVFSK